MSEDRKHEERIFTDGPPEARAEILQQDVEAIRDDLTGLVNELDRRRHAFFDVKRQISRHPLPLALVGLGLVGLVVAGLALAARNRRRRAAAARPLARLRQRLGLATQPRSLATRP